MMRHVDILDERDSLKRPLLGSVLLHAVVFGFIGVMTIAQVGKRESWGDPNSAGGGAFTVTPVKAIPLPGRTGPVNKVASDTESQIPEPVKAKPEPKRAVKDDPKAISLKSKKNAKAEKTERYASNRRDPREYSDNQVYSRAGQAATSPLYGLAPGSGGVGVGNGMPFGNRFGAYAQLIRERVAQRWKTETVDGRIKTLPPAIVTFEIMRNGQVRNIKVFQSSGNVALDYSAQRAITEAAPFEPLPAAYDGSSATIEFWFQLKR
ncbi:MAG TPA: TonB family protein [Paludibaculum sp.]|jgi:protein TonB